MRIEFFQHVAFEDPGCIANWAKYRGHQLSYTLFYDPFHLPDPDNFDMLVVMGGPMSVNDTSQHPYLTKEIEFIGQCIEKKKLVLGICLGSQLIIRATGGAVFPSGIKEIGWFFVKMLDSFLSINKETGNDELTVFHWHGDTYHLPEGAKRLARSEAIENQAFLVEKHVLGIQFHFEVMENNVNAMLLHCANELTEGKYIQTKEEINAGKKYISSNNKIMYRILDEWVKGNL